MAVAATMFSVPAWRKRLTPRSRKPQLMYLRRMLPTSLLFL